VGGGGGAEGKRYGGAAVSGGFHNPVAISELAINTSIHLKAIGFPGLVPEADHEALPPKRAVFFHLHVACFFYSWLTTPCRSISHSPLLTEGHKGLGGHLQ